MALSASTIWEVETGGSDTLNGGAFDPSQTAGMLTDGVATSANTNAPVFSSASYNFVAGDVGAWVYLASGSTGATIAAGWYKINSVAANKATLEGTIGLAVLRALTPSTVIGCANGASPTVITWTIDYSQQSAAQFTYTDLASVGAGLLVSSVAFPFGKQQVGNALVITGGTNFTTGRYVIASVSVGLVATVVGAANITTGAGVSGTGGQGGALASPGQGGAAAVANNWMAIKSGTYSVTSATANISSGCVSWPASSGGAEGKILGYNSVRGDNGTRPLLQAGNAISTFTLISLAGQKVRVVNVSVDGANLTASKGIANATNTTGVAYLCKAVNCKSGGIATYTAILCEATTCSTTTAIGSPICFGCWSHDNTIGGFSCAGTFSAVNIYVNCIASNNSGASSSGFALSASSNMLLVNCIAYTNGQHGFTESNSSTGQPEIINCIAMNNVGTGFIVEGAIGVLYLNCATFGNGTAFGTSATASGNINPVTLSADPFTNAAGNDYSLNNTAGAGAACRAAGTPGAYPAGSTTGYPDIGAAQHKYPTWQLVNPGMGGGINA